MNIMNPFTNLLHRLERSMTTAHTSQDFWNLRDSLQRAKLRAKRYYRDKRMLETKVRDLERSRELWKTKFNQLIQPTQTELVSDSPPQP